MAESPIHQNGLAASAVGKETIRLWERDGLWLVESGSVDIFAVPLSGGTPSGRKWFMGTAGPGELLFGVKNRDTNCQSGLFADGSFTATICPQDEGEFIRRFIQTDSGSREHCALQRWLELLVSELLSSLPKPSDLLLAPVEGQITLEPGQAVLCEPGRFLWCTILEGSAAFMGMTDCTLEKGSVFPLPADCWLTATTPVVVDCTTALRWPGGLHPFKIAATIHAGLLACYRQRTVGGERDFAERAARKSASYQKKYHNALERIAGVMRGDDSSVSASHDSDTLFSSAFLVGNAAGITIKKPVMASLLVYEEPLQAICRFSGVRLRSVVIRKDASWWQQDNGPLLGYRGEEKIPVALLPDGSKGYRMVDLADNSSTAVNGEVAGEIGQQAWMFYRPFPEKKLRGRELLSFGLRGSGADIWRLVLLGLAGALLGLLTPVLTGQLFGTVIPQSSRGQLLQLTLILVASVISVSGFDLARQIAVMRLQTRMDMQLQPALMDRLLNLPSTFFRNYSSGDLALRVMGATQIREILSSSAVSVLLGLLFGLFNLMLLLYYSWKLALVAILLTTVIIAISAWFSFRQLALNREMMTLQGKISGLLGNLLTSITKIRVTGTEKPAFAKWAELFSKERGIGFQAGTIQNILAATTTTFPVVALAVIIFTAGRFLLADKLDSGSFIAFTSAYTSFQSSLMQTVMTVIASLNVIPLYERIKPLLETVTESGETRTYPGKLSGQIEIRSLNFSYSKESPEILHNIQFSAAPGEFIALVGSSGAGKSSLLRLLLGFEKPDSGTVFYDGIDLATLNVQAVRRQIGVVMQNGQLMPGFLLQNIIGASLLTVDDAWQAAAMACLDEDIRQMPMGMYTMISEGGGTLSGGQKQRLLIAGALVRKPNIIFFDEATSALDNQTQEVVRKSIEQLDATCIVIAQRLSTIRNADRIYCLDNGHIVQSGTYDELMAEEGLFRQLAKRQIA